MPKGYWIGSVDVTNPTRYEDYKSTAQPAYQKYGARFIVRGGPSEVMEGSFAPRMVVLEFPSLQAAYDCYNSPDYSAARAIRQEIATGSLAIVEGHDG